MMWAASLARDMFDWCAYLTDDSGTTAVTYKPWHLQIQESDESCAPPASGVWRVVANFSFRTMAEGEAFAARAGIDLDYVSRHYADDIRVTFLGKCTNPEPTSRNPDPKIWLTPAIWGADYS